MSRGATVARMIGTGNKDRGYRSVNELNRKLRKWSTRATLASVGAIRTKDSGYRSVKNAANLSVVEPHCSSTRHSDSVTHTAEDD